MWALGFAIVAVELQPPYTLDESGYASEVAFALAALSFVLLAVRPEARGLRLLALGLSSGAMLGRVLTLGLVEGDNSARLIAGTLWTLLLIATCLLLLLTAVVPGRGRR